MCAEAPPTPPRECRDYCQNNVYYSSGIYNSRTVTCDYSLRRNCEYGCNIEGTNCVSAPTFPSSLTSPSVTHEEEVNRNCPDYCSDNVRYYGGVYNSETKACEYQIERCEYGCNEKEVKCIERVNEQENIKDEEERQERVPNAEESILTKERIENIERALNDLEKNRRGTKISPTVTVELPKSPTEPLVARYLERGKIKNVDIKVDRNLETEIKDNNLIIKSKNKEYKAKSEFDKLLSQCVKRNETLKELKITIRKDKPVYGIEKTKKVEILWRFPVNLKIRETVDAENLSLIKEKKSWWSFLITNEEPEKENIQCGDGICQENEGSDICPKDCGALCGNNVCDITDFQICPWDCPQSCGDKICCIAAPVTDEDCQKISGFKNAYKLIFDGEGLVDFETICTSCPVEESSETCPVDCSLHACGNGKCEVYEGPDICPADCGSCGDGICGHHELDECSQDCLPACGNGKCEATEKASGCIVDCGYCGDSFCGLTEGPQNCPNDCKPACGDGYCSYIEIDNCPVDCNSPCGNQICEGGENPENCWVDCGHSYLSTKENLCGNGICNGGENPQNCPVDCGPCLDGICSYWDLIHQDWCSDCKPSCGNKICDNNETQESCVFDCGICGDGICLPGEQKTCKIDCPDFKLTGCGDGACDGLENEKNCATDCLKTCGDGKCDKNESLKSCPNDCKSSCGNGKCEIPDLKIMCAMDCSAKCGDGLCNGVESENTCPIDCSTSKTIKVIYDPNPFSSCGDGFCKQGETIIKCPQDCTGKCGNTVCDFGENNEICPTDCAISCGNGVCNNYEGNEKCPIDCGHCGDNYCQQPIENEKNCKLDCSMPCGDGFCNQGETAENCSIDCKEKNILTNIKCGNKITEDNSVCINCEWDCGSCGDGICALSEYKKCKVDCFSACGNGICEFDESAKSCPFDCVGLQLFPLI